MPRTLALAAAGADGTFGAATEALTPADGGALMSSSEGFDGQGRRSGWTLSLGGTPVSNMSYSYNGQGQLGGIAFMGAAASWTYHYQGGTRLMSGISAAFAGGSTVELNRGYDSQLRLQSLAYQVGGGTRLGWSYGYDPQHPQRRISTTSLVPGLPGWAYGYDGRGQVTAAARAASSDGTPVPGQSWGYAYDAIGNRTASTRGQAGETNTGGVRTTGYAASGLNQYTSITRPNSVEITGVTHPDVPTVKVNGQPATGRPPGNGEPGGFAQWLDGVAGGSQPNGQWPEVTLAFDKPGAGAQGADAQYTRSGHVYVRPSETPQYDDDGNLVQDACWTYTWDAENRLIAAEMRDVGLPASVDLRRVEFSYDAHGRRFERHVKVKSTPTGSTVRGTTWQETSHVRFWYDGWNLVAETDNSGTVQHQYVWGTDLSGTLQGAGGVGGLLAVVSAGHTYAVCTEVNGNVMGLIDAQTGQLAARWDYDAFGNLVTDWYAPGVTGAVCAMRFSSKYLEADLGEYYYGYRYYAPELGRWLSRDLIEESGGLNLCGMVRNDPINGLDYLGLADPVGHHIVAQKLFNGKVKQAVQEFFDSEAARIYNDAYRAHSNMTVENITHSRYTELVEQELKEFLGGKEIKDMELEEARAFMAHLGSLPSNHGISIFNAGVEAEVQAAAEAAAKGMTQRLINAMVRASRGTVSKLTAEGGVLAAAKGVGETAAKRAGTVITVGISLWSISDTMGQEGLGNALIEEYRNGADPFGQNLIFQLEGNWIKDHLNDIAPKLMGFGMCDTGPPKVGFKNE